MNIMFFGPQGSGKGTQARLLCNKYNLYYFESGAYLRRIAEKNEELQLALNSGQLVPDLEMTSYLTAFFDEKNLYNDIVFDGFPRTLEQYNFLKNWLNQKQVKIDLGVVIEISEDETVKRLSARRQDPNSGEIYSLIEGLPEGIKEEELVQREDDKSDAIKKRLYLYRTRTEKLIEEMKKEIKFIQLDGERPVEEIFKDLSSQVENIKNG